MTSEVEMKAGGALRDSDHVLRYIGKRHVDHGVVNGSGFLARLNEDSPSVNWLEYYPPPVDNQIANISSLRRLKYEKRALLVRINIGQSRSYVSANSPTRTALVFAYDPLPPDEARNLHADPSHAEIRGIPKEGAPVSELIADLLCDCILDRFEVKADR
jgi:hypothetical protein